MTGRTQTVVVIAADLGNTWVTPILHGVANRVAIEGIVPIIAETNDDSTVLADLIDHMLSRRVDGMIILAARRQDADVIESAGRLIPLVVAARPLPDLSVSVVTHDDRRGGEMVAEHFASLGHELMAQLRGPADVLNFPLRDEGFTKVAEEAGVQQAASVGNADTPTPEEGVRLMNYILEDPQRPTAIFAHNDAMAIGAIDAIRRRGLSVPDDISVVGYNDMPLTGLLAPPLTTVRYPSWEVGRMAADVILKLLATPDSAESTCLDPRFVLRGSTAPPRR